MKAANRLIVVFIFAFSASTGLGQKQQTRYDEFIEGYTAFNSQKYDSAFDVFTHYLLKPDKDIYTAWAYTYLGHIYWQHSDLYNSQKNLLTALSILASVKESERGDLPGFLYNLLGNVNLDLGRYNEAINYYTDALPFFEGKDYAIEVMNGTAVAFQRMKNYPKAITTYNFALTFKPKDRLLTARILDNRARTEWLQDSGYAALNEFHAALKIRSDSNYYEGLTASYGHLSDYFVRKNADSALWYAHKMHEAGLACNNMLDILSALDKLTLSSSSPDSIKKWHAEYKELNESIQFAKDTTPDRFELKKYDPRNNKVDNLSKELIIAKQKTQFRYLIIVAIAVILLLTIWYNIRRRKLKRDSENAIRNSKLKTSQRVHDVVANGLYGIMNELEHKDVIDKEPLINKIEDLYEKSRNISHEETPAENDTAYDRQIHALLSAYSNGETDVFIIGNQPEFWSAVSTQQKQELQLVLEELLVNMKKHSRAKNVIVEFSQRDHHAHIIYKDDGVGFSGATEGSGAGRKNTVSRIKSLYGDITFDKSEKGGALVAINFPLQSKKL